VIIIPSPLSSDLRNYGEPPNPLSTGNIEDFLVFGKQIARPSEVAFYRAQHQLNLCVITVVSSSGNLKLTSLYDGIVD